MISLLFFTLILGPIVGSFLNVVILRTHQKQAWWKGRSHCPTCRHSLVWYDLLPLVSYLTLAGRCRYCKGPIAWQYPLVEYSTGLLFGLVYYVTIGPLLPWDMVTWVQAFILARNLIAAAVLVILFVYDFRWKLLPDRVTLPSIAFFFVVNLIVAGTYTFCNPLGVSCYMLAGWTDYLAGGILGAGFFFIQYAISRGKWIGGGDIRFGALMGVLLGFSGTAMGLFIAYCIGAVWGIGLIVSGKKKMDSAIPFGTFLSLATLIVLLWYPQISSIVQSFFAI